MNLEEARKKLPELAGLNDETALGVINESYYPNMDRAELASRLGYTPPKTPTPERSWGALAKDVGITAVKGAIGVPEALVGLADIPTGGQVGKFLENEGGDIGFRPKQAKDFLSEGYSAQQQTANQNFASAEGIGGKFQAAIQNPSVVAHTIGESLPAMFAGGGVARGILAAAPKVAGWAAGAVGEGIIGAGSAASQIRQETSDGLLTAKQSGLAAATGAATFGFGALGGKVAQRLGIADVDTMLAGAAANTAVRKGVVRSTLEAAVSEGVLEELPQSVSETVLQNLALDKPIDENIDQAIVLGTLAGGVMGGGANLASRAMGSSEAKAAPESAPVNPAAPVAPIVPVIPAGPPPGPLTRAANLAQTMPLGVTPGDTPSLTPFVTPLGETAATITATDPSDNPEQGQISQAAPEQVAQAEPVEPTGAQGQFATGQEAQDYISGQRRAASIKLPPALPIEFADNTHGVAVAGSPDFKEATAQKNKRDLIDAGVQEGDMLNPSGGVLKTKASATNLQKKNGGVVVPVTGGFVVRPVAVPPDGTESAAIVPPDGTAGMTPTTSQTLPQDLAGAKPRYNYGNKAFTLNFSSDVDRAAMIAAQDTPSKKDAAYLSFAMQATGMNEAEVRAHGQAVKDSIKAQAKDAQPGILQVDALFNPQGSTNVQNVAAARPAAAGVQTGAGVVQADGVAATTVVAPKAPAAAPSITAAKVKAPTATDAEQIAAAIDRADRNGLLGKDRRDAVLEDLSDTWGMAKDEVSDVPEVTAALKKKANPAAKTAAAESFVEGVMNEALAANRAMKDQSDTTDAPNFLGKNNVPMSEGGKPYKTRLSATKVKKLQPMMRVAVVDGGYVLVEKSQKALDAEERNALRLSTPNTSPANEAIPAHAMIAAAGGLKPDTRADMGMQGNVKIGNRTLFAGKDKGLTIEQATEKLIEDGYLPEDAGHDDARNLIKRSLNNPQYTPEGTERMAEKEKQEQADANDAEQEAIAAQRELDDNEWLNTVEAAEAALLDIPEGDTQSRMNLADAMGVAQFTEQEIQDATTFGPREPQSNRQSPSSTSQTTSGQSPQSDSGREGAPSSVQGQDAGLTAPSRQDVLDQQQRTAAIEKSNASQRRAEQERLRLAGERKDIAQASEAAADTFELGGNAEQNLSGQGGMFDVLPTPATGATEFVTAPNGTSDFGVITPDMSKATRRQAGKIRLRQGNDAWGLTHIEQRHGKDFKALGFDGSVDFVSKVAHGFTKIYQGGGAALDVVIDDEKRGMLIVKLEPSADGDFYDVKTATPIRRDQFKNEKPLWERDGPIASTAFDGSTPYPKDQSGTEILGAASTSVKPDKIEDSGQVLEGARKLYAKNYAAKMEEGRGMDTAAVPLSKSWPEPDYQRLLDEGADPWAVALAHAVRDEIPNKPSSWKLKGWVTNVEMLRDMADKAMSGEITQQQFQTLGVKHSLMDWFNKIDLYQGIGHGRSLKAVTFAKGSYGMFGGETFSPPKVMWTITESGKGAQGSWRNGNWGNQLAAEATKVEAILAFQNYETERAEAQEGQPAVSKATTFDIYSFRSKPGFIVGKRLGGKKTIDLKTFDTVKEAREYKTNNQAVLERLLQESKVEPDERGESNSPRVGADHRNGTDVTTAQFRDTFGFRGEQFGASMPQGERQANLNQAYDALMDLAGVVGVPAKALSLNGELGLAFGARGKGGKNSAMAHYELDTTGAVTPNRVVINLTRKSGAGSLAHEWFHAVDNYFARMRGEKAGMLTNNPNPAGEGVRPEMVTAFKQLTLAIKSSGVSERSKRLDKHRVKDYWSTGLEMAARSFESYVIAKLQDQNFSNDYLSNIVSEAGYTRQETYPYPTMGEMPAIRAAFDNFFETVQTRETDQGVALFSRATATQAERNALDALSQNDTMFAMVKSDKKTVADIAAETDPDITVKTVDYPGLVKSYVLTMANGGIARLMVRSVNPYGPQAYGQVDREDGEFEAITERPGRQSENVEDGTEDVYIDVSTLKEGGQGGRIYNIAATFAHNTGRILIGDPAGLSNAAMRRRTEHMLSSALKFGTTRHLAPHPRQVDGASGIGVPPLQWTYGDDLGNIKALIDVSLKSLKNADGSSFTFDLPTGTFRDSSGGVVDDDAISLAVGPGQTGKGNTGITTYKRSAVLSALVRQQSESSGSRGQGNGLLEKLVDVGSQFPASSKGIFYSRGDSASSGRVSEVQRAVDALTANWANKPKVVVAANMQDPQIPQRVRDYNEAQLSQGATGQPEGFFLGGKVYVIADQLPDDAAILRVLAHESLGHYGLRGLFGDKLNPILKQIGAVRRKEVIAKAEQYGLDLKIEKDLLTAAEEVLAEMAQTQPELGFVKRAIAVIRTWLRANVPGFKDLSLTDAEIVANYLLPARDWVQRGKDAQVAGAVPALSRSAMKSVDANIQRGMASLAEALDEKTTVHRAMFRNGLGWVDFVWGSEGTLKLSGATKGAMGLSHILEARQRKDGLTDGEAVRLLGDIVTTIASGQETSRQEVSGSVRIGVEHTGTAVWLTKPKGSNAWIVTGYRKNPDGPAAGRATAEPTSTAASLTRDSRVAGFSKIVAQDLENGNPDIRFSRTSPIDAALKATVVTDITKAAGHKLADFRSVGLQLLGGRQLNDLYSKDLPQLNGYTEMVQQMAAEANDVGANADKVVTAWGNLKDEQQLAELMHDATLEQIDPAKPFVTGDSRAAWDRLNTQFNKLSADAKKVYTDARDGYEEHYAQVREAIQEKIERSDMAKPAKAAMIERMDGEFFEKIKGVYFPLARFGEYVVVTRNAAGEAVNVSRAESTGEADALQKQMRKDFPASKGFVVGKVLKDREFNAGRDSVGRGFLKDLFGVLDKEGVGADLQDAVNQLYLASMPDLSWAKHGMHRKGTPGFSQNARRAYAQNMFHGARYLAKLRYADQLQAKLAQMEGYIESRNGDESYDQPKARDALEEITKRNDSLMNPKSSAVSTALTSLGFVFFLGLSPASAAVNLSQTALVAYPIMGAKWGFGKAAAALTRAGKQAAANKNDISSALKGDELRAYEAAVASGTIDVTNAHDLAGISQGEDQGITWKVRPVMRWASFLFHHAERFNRQVTFVASYRLARDAKASHDEAFEQATKATYDGHFDYSASNRPRAMQGPVAKVLTLFKQFGQNMVYTLVRQAQLAMNAETPAGRKEARKALGGILALHASAAGVLGLPLVGPLLAAASMLGGSDDEPWDAEVALRNMLADTFGQKPAEVMARGLSRLTPFDLSGRVALDRLIFPDVQEGLEGQRLAESYALAALGPVGGIGLNLAKGLQEISQGHTLRGFETMMPTALRSPMRALRYGQEGNVDKSGVVINNEISVAGLIGQAAGFAPSEARNAQEGRSAIFQADTAIRARRSTLMREFAQASIGKDEAGKAAARKEIMAFNKVNPKMRILPTQLALSVRARMRRTREAEQGVYLPSNRRESLDAGRFALGDGE